MTTYLIIVKGEIPDAFITYVANRIKSEFNVSIILSYTHPNELEIELYSNNTHNLLSACFQLGKDVKEIELKCWNQIGRKIKE